MKIKSLNNETMHWSAVLNEMIVFKNGYADVNEKIAKVLGNEGYDIGTLGNKKMYQKAEQSKTVEQPKDTKKEEPIKPIKPIKPILPIVNKYNKKV